jgi:hypothetical protein
MNIKTRVLYILTLCLVSISSAYSQDDFAYMPNCEIWHNSHDGFITTGYNVEIDDYGIVATYYHTNKRIDSSGFLRFVRINYQGDIELSSPCGYHYDTDTSFLFTELYEYQEKLYSRGIKLIRLPDDKYILYLTNCRFDYKTLTPYWEEMIEQYVDTAYRFIGGYSDFYAPVVWDRKYGKIKYFRGNINDRDTVDEVVKLWYNVNLKTNKFSLKYVGYAEEDYTGARYMRPNFMYTDSFFYNFGILTPFSFDEFTHTIDTQRFWASKYSPDFEYIDSFYPRAGDLNQFLDVGDLSCLPFESFHNGFSALDEVGIVTNDINGNGWFDTAFYLVKYELINDTLKLVKKIDLNYIHDPNFFPGYSGYNTVRSYDNSVFYIKPQPFDLYNFQMKVYKLDSNLDILWSRIYRNSSGIFWTGSTYETSVMLPISDGDGGMFMSFKGRDTSAVFRIYYIWIDAYGNLQYIDKDKSFNDDNSIINSSVFQDYSLELYPIPAKKILKIRNHKLDKIEYKIMDLSGKTILSGYTIDRVNVESLDIGAYLFYYKTEELNDYQIIRFEISH